MSEGTAVSLVWLLVLLLLTGIVSGVSMVFLLGALVVRMDILNAQLLQWRTQFSKTFQYVEDDADVSNLWGDEQEAR